MRDESVARRYAAALFETSRRADSLAVVRNDLNSVAAAIRQVPALRTLLQQPLIVESKKKAAIQSLFTGKVHPSLLAFMHLLVDKRRIDLLPEINDEFDRLVRNHLNIALATATTAVPLTADETKQLTLSLQERTGRTIELKTEVDPSLLGGVLVRIGDTVYDGSVRGKLDRLREHLLARR
ncbi:MAG: F0F1 ATP synthase subunit delta [Capsulimonadales bacterium]|nr:F0F1 ATP synthase subunit delta [Capsulimonadales bacterium]